MTPGYAIRPLERDDLTVFFAYLNDHLSDNGVGGTARFMPLPLSESRFSPDKEAAFRSGMEAPVGQPGWRRGWLVLGPDGEIAGHIDLRARPEKACAHRALLGMGVHREHRQQGLGGAMVAVAIEWAIARQLAWIDLDVLSVNEAALQLYRRTGFTLVGEMPDMFRLDGQSFGHTVMTMKLG